MNAGIFIGLAAVLYVRCENPVVSSVLFSVGLLACLLYQEPLCTGRANQPWYAITHRNDKYCLYKWYEIMSLWWILYAINGFFALWLGCVSRLCIDVSRANDIVMAKLEHPWYWMLFMGFLCGLFIQIAVHAWDKSRGGWPIVVLCVAGFLLLGGEHCVADAAFIGMMTPCGDWSVALGCAKLVLLAGLGNLLAGVIFWREPRGRRLEI